MLSLVPCWNLVHSWYQELSERMFIDILTQLTIICRDRKEFFSFSNFSSCGLFDSKISSASFHVSLEEKKKGWERTTWSKLIYAYRFQITFISAMLFLGSILFNKRINLSENRFIWYFYAYLCGFWSKFSFKVCKF